MPAALGVQTAAVDWAAQYEPQVVQDSDGPLTVETKLTRLLNRPPLILAGMTPCTSLDGKELVAAVANAGYHAELAGGWRRRRGSRRRTRTLRCGSGVLPVFVVNATQDVVEDIGHELRDFVLT